MEQSFGAKLMHLSQQMKGISFHQKKALAMADFREQMEEIKALLSSGNKALAYPKLLHLQKISASDSSSIQKFTDSSHSILSSLLPDIFHNDEEIAAQALKCLGFMIYNPPIVAAIGGDDANVIIESLVEVIATTKIKSICNLGVWCISIQQFSSSMLGQHLHSLLRAVIHAIDNPIGSLSTTFEAMQAVVKLTSSLSKEMRSLSSVWLPPIYRRLVSVDKRDRDMSERCLLKIKPIICPPPVILSKALVVDLKKILLLAMKELVDQGMKIQSLQAWGWFMRLLGPYVMKNKHLVNEMLKILEQTVSDFDSQVQIASLVAWEDLIDALIEPPVKNSPANFASGHGDVVLSTSEGKDNWIESDKYLKRIKLIMTPLIGIMSSKCDVSVHACCLSTWSYLLHKLKGSVSCQSVIKNVWEPIIELVFRAGTDSKNILLLYFCLDLLHALISGKNQQTFGDPYNQETNILLLKNTTVSNLSSGKYPLRPYPINCSPWNLSQLDMFLKMISVLTQESNATGNPEGRRWANEAALRLFESLLEAVHRAIIGASITYDDIMQCLNTIFGFLAKICENVNSVDDCSYYYSFICLKYLEVVTEILESSILESPLYKLGLEFTCIKKSEPASEIKFATVLSMCSLDFEEKVIPVVYLSILYFSVVNSSSKESDHESLLQKMQDYVKFLLSSCHSQEVIHAFVCSLYRVSMVDGLQIWVVLANCLKDFVDGENGQSILKMETNNIGYSLVLLLLAYPFASWSSSHINLKLQIVIEPWKLLYLSVEQASLSVHFPVINFSEDLCAILNGFIDQTILVVDSRNDLHQENIVEFVLLCGSIIILILKQLTLSISSKGSKSTDCDGRKYGRKNGMELAARFMKLFRANKPRIEPSYFSLASRFFSKLVSLVGCLRQKEDIVMLIGITSSPLLEWLLDMHLLDKNINYQLQMLWSGILQRLLQYRSSLMFDSSMLKLQQPLLERTLDHQNPTISEPIINFWNSTYGEQIKLDLPQNLLPVLDKLYRSGNIKLCNRTCHMTDSINRLQRNKVISTLNKCSKRVENIGNPTYGSQQDLSKLNFSTKRKQPELTEHQREVRRAQQGRSRDCNGRGPGIRTYTAVDFSQGNEESQDSEDIRDSESILEMLKKVC